jgi:hypothetical protein
MLSVEAGVVQAGPPTWVDLGSSLSVVVLSLVAVYFAWLQVEHKLKVLLFAPELEIRLEENAVEDRLAYTSDANAPGTIPHRFTRERDGTTVALDANTEYELLYFIVTYPLENHRFSRLAGMLKPVVFEPLMFWLLLPENYRILRAEDTRNEDIGNPSDTSLHRTDAPKIHPDRPSSLANTAYAQSNEAKDVTINRRYILFAQANRFTARDEHAMIVPVWVRTPDEPDVGEIRAIVNASTMNHRQERYLRVEVT